MVIGIRDAVRIAQRAIRVPLAVVLPALERTFAFRIQVAPRRQVLGSCGAAVVVFTVIFPIFQTFASSSVLRLRCAAKHVARLCDIWPACRQQHGEANQTHRSTGLVLFTLSFGVIIAKLEPYFSKNNGTNCCSNWGEPGHWVGHLQRLPRTW